MGFKREAPVVDAQNENAQPSIKAEGKDMGSAPKERTDGTRKYTDDERRVHGQVKMHGIVCGYKVAAILAPTLANTSASIKDELHKLAGEVAAKIEAYSFSEE